MSKLMFSTKALYEEIKKELNISFNCFYSHLEYLYYNGCISYPNTNAKTISPFFNDFEFFSNEDFEKLKIKKPECFDFERRNNHNPLFPFKLNYVFNKEDIFTEEFSEFGKEDFNNPMFGKKLNHLEFIYQKLVETTKLVLEII